MMNADKIAAAGILDIIFDGRNKSYGAYQLRRSYNKRLATAVGSVLLFCMLLFFTSMLTGRNSLRGISPLAQDVQLTNVPDDPSSPPPPPPPPPPATSTIQIETIQFATPVIAPDADVQEMPPVDAIDNARIGLVNNPGDPYDGSVVAPPETGTGLASLPVAPKEDYEKMFFTAEFSPEFPGGLGAWQRYLERNLRMPEAAIENQIQSTTVRIQFTVDRDGNLSDIIALNDPGDGLAEEAVRIVKRSPQWRPAEQNGRKVIFRHTQNITFQLQ